LSRNKNVEEQGTYYLQTIFPDPDTISFNGKIRSLS